MKAHTIIRRIDSENEQEARFYEGIFIDPKTKAEERVWVYPSVTSKLGEAYPTGFYLQKWIRDMGDWGNMVFEKAAESGTQVHEIIEQLLHGVAYPSAGLDGKVKRCVSSFLAWFKEANPEILATEHIVYNHEFKYAGCVDLVCRIKDVVWLIDYKTSNTIHQSHRCQVAADHAALPKEQQGHAALLHLGNRTKAGYSFLEVDLPENWELFKHFNKTFDLLNPDAKPNETTYPAVFMIPELVNLNQPKNEISH
jgi:hypothetical protein